jgi:hypothetical protein
MAAFRFFNPAPVYYGLLGIDPVAGGSLTFYDLGTTNPRNTWSDADLTTLNTNPVPLDSSGRSNVNIFLDGEYSVLLKDAEGATIWTRDVISGAEAGQTIPPLEPNEFLTNDGVNLLWQPVREMPDPTGSTNQYPVTNGSGYTLTNVPEPEPPPDPDITVDEVARLFTAGISSDPTKLVMVSGTGQAPASGSYTTSASISFPDPFDTLWNVIITVTTDRVTNADTGWLPAQSVTGWTPGSGASGATVNFTLTEDDPGPPTTFTSPVPFAWTAIGTREIEP